MTIAPAVAGPQRGSEDPGLDGGLDSQTLDGGAPSPCEVTFAEEEPWMFMGPEDDSEIFEASHALIELQWSR